MDIEQSARQQQAPAEMQLRVESWALWMGLAATVAGIVVGLIGFAGQRTELAGTGSVAVFAAIVAALSATSGSLVGYLKILSRTQAWLVEFPLYRQIINAGSLVIIHGAISAMAALSTFRVFQNAFVGLTVDKYAGSIMVGVCAGIAAYVSLQSAARVTARSLSTLLALFMATGVFISMLAAEDPLWWHSKFSSLGTRESGLTSFWSFNVTLVVSGLVLSTLTAFIVRDLNLVAGIHDVYIRVAVGATARPHRPRPTMVSVCLLGIGVSVMGIGLVPVSVVPAVHAVLAWSCAGFILVLFLGAAFWLPGFPKIFHVFSFACILGLAGAELLWQPLHYYNLTGFELAVVGIVFGWLAVFVRTTAAVLAVKESELRRARAASAAGDST